MFFFKCLVLVPQKSNRLKISLLLSSSSLSLSLLSLSLSLSSLSFFETKKNYLSFPENEFGESNPPTTEEEINQILKGGVFHVTHHLIWVSMLHIGERMAGNSLRCKNGAAAHL